MSNARPEPSQRKVETSVAEGLGTYAIVIIVLATLMLFGVPLSIIRIQDRKLTEESTERVLVRAGVAFVARILQEELADSL